MKKEFVFLMFCLCFCVWVLLVDNFLIPDVKTLSQNRGLYSRYKIRKAIKDGDLGLTKDKILIYAHVKDREQFYYIDYSPYFEASLKQIPPGQPLTLKFSKGFPKVWQRTLYDVRMDGVPVLRYSSAQLEEKQTHIWKLTGILGGIFLILSLLGFVGKPLKKRKK